MTTITSWKDGNKETVQIQTKDIDQIKSNYLNKFNISSLTEASLKIANKLFISVINDFKNGKLSIDELSSFGSEIFHTIAKKNKESDLFQASLSASELSYTVRNQATFSNIPSYLNDIEVFYQNNK